MLFGFKGAGIFSLNATIRMTMELSTIFLNIHLFLVQLKLKKHPCFKINGLIFFFTFFIMRIVPILFQWNFIFTFASQSEIVVDRKIFYLYSFLSLIHDSLNLIWFSKIALATVKYHKNWSQVDVLFYNKKSNKNVMKKFTWSSNKNNWRHLTLFYLMIIFTKQPWATAKME